jgi:predicted acetyltransferase
MSIELELSDEVNAQAVRNLFPLYCHDISEYDGSLPNRNGIFGEDGQKTLVDPDRELDSWWGDRDRRIPYLIKVDHIPAGFCFIERPEVPHEGADNYVIDFFVIRSLRNKGIGQFAAEEILKKYPGRWLIRISPKNKPARRFWQKVVKSMDGEPSIEETVDDEDLVCYRFTIA